AGGRGTRNPHVHADGNAGVAAHHRRLHHLRLLDVRRQDARGGWLPLIRSRHHTGTVESMLKIICRACRQPTHPTAGSTYGCATTTSKHQVKENGLLSPGVFRARVEKYEHGEKRNGGRLTLNVPALQ